MMVREIARLLVLEDDLSGDFVISLHSAKITKSSITEVTGVVLFSMSAFEVPT